MFLALDRHDGSVIWSYDTSQDGSPAQFHGDPLILDDMVVTGCDRSDQSHTYAFALETGALVWKHGESALETDILPAGGLAVSRRWNGDLLALDPATGERVWTLQPDDYTYPFRYDCSPVAGENRVFFGDTDGAVCAVDGRTGQVIWRYDTGEAITASVALAGDDLYAGLANHDLLRFEVGAGTLLGRIELAEMAFGRPAVADDAVLVMTGRGDLVALARDLSVEIWRQDGEPLWSTPRPLVWRGLVIVGGPQGEVRGFRTGSGEPALALNLDGRIRGLGAHEDVLYIGAMNGNLFACRPTIEPAAR